MTIRIEGTRRPPLLSARGAVEPFHAMDIFRAANALAAKGVDVLHMEVGQPSTPAPAPVIEAAKRALTNDRLAYTDGLGLWPLREAIAGHYRERCKIDVPAERIAITTGASGGLVLALLAAFEAGDRVAMASPSYPAYRNIMTALGLQPVIMPVGEAQRFCPNARQLDQLPGPLRGVLLASPANPTGTMMSQDVVQGFVRDCDSNSRWLIVDEIYHGIVYDKPAESVLALTDRAIVVNSFSKYFSMTGWRIGWLVVPPGLVRTIERLSQNLFISAPTLSQLAAMAAFDAYDELDANVAVYARNRDVLLHELPKAGFDRMAPPDGAFYIYADVSRFTNDAQNFCQRMLAETGIATTPGIDFDRERGHLNIRISFCGSTERTVEVARRLKAWNK